MCNLKIYFPADFNKVCITIMLLMFIFNSVRPASVKEAGELASNEKYTEAYNMLNELGVNTPEAFYLKGLCMYYLNTGLDEAVVLLTKALSAGGPERIRLVLGMIYHRQYRFTDAQRLLKEYITMAKTQEDKDLTLLYIKFCQNANAVSHRGKMINVLGNTSVKFRDIPIQYNEQPIDGIVVPKPYNLNSKADEKNTGENILMMLPKDTEKIKYVFYAAYEAGRPDHSDIFMVEVLDNGEFSTPENLGTVINTPQDEMYPYFDEENQVLYFASKGHQSIGGYDIFMSYYNAGAESWSKPINMGLPFNSTANDYFIMPLERDNEFLFTTDRNASFENVEVARVLIPPGADYKTLVQREDIIAFNQLKLGRASVSNMPASPDGNGIEDEKYKLLVEKALNYQVRADSIKRKMHEQEQKINVALGESRKMQLSSDLKLMEDEYRILKEQADIHYDAVREWERQNGIISSQISIQEETPDEEIIVHEYPVNNENNNHEIQENGPVKVETKQTEIIVQSTLPAVTRDIESSADLPVGVIFTVQVGVFSKKVDKLNFAGMKTVFYYFIPGRDLYKYYTGVFNNINDARDYLVQVKQKGYSDAFLVAFDNKQPVSLESALQK